MRREIQSYLSGRQDLVMFVRENPLWYRILNRNPEKVFEIEQAAKVYYGKTFPQKIERIQQQIQLANMLVGMMNGMGNHE